MQIASLGNPTLDQAIDSVFGMFGAERQPLNVTMIGEYGIMNPGSKAPDTLVQKLDRKHRTVEEAHWDTDKVLQRHITGNEANAFDEISDYVRFSVIVPKFTDSPAVLATLMADFGGKITIHNRRDYKAFHLHFKYKGINCEIQIQTLETAALKKGTDILYHNYRDVIIPKNSRIEQEYEKERDQMIKHCNVIYKHSDFNEALPAVRNLARTYQARTHDQKQNGMKLKHFLMIVKKAAVIQNELGEKLEYLLKALDRVQDQSVELGC